MTGCGTVGILISDSETFIISDQINLKATKEDILDIVADVGRSMDFKVKEIDRRAKTISITTQSSLFRGVMIGSSSTADITVILGDNIEIKVITSGNFGAGGQKAAEELLQKFKEKLLEKLK
jgi:hypothetical protein